MQKLRSDVTVIGSGPAGSTVAKIVGKSGFDVILVEKDEYPGKTNVCAGGVPKSIIKDMELSSDIIEKEITGQEHYFPWGSRFFDLDHVTVNRNSFDRILAKKAVKAGAKMLTNTQIKDASVKNNRASVFYKENSIDSKLIVFADGPNTMAYRKFGIGFKPEPAKTIVSVACEVKWDSNPLDHYEFYYGSEISQWGYGWIFPKKNTVNVGVVCLSNRVSSNIIESLNHLLKKHPLTHEKLKDKEIVWQSSALIPVAPAKRIFGEGMLVVGDAAGMVDPISGGGIASSIRGGELAGKVCVIALEEEKFSSEFLSQYQRLWHKSRIYSYIYGKYILTKIFQNLIEIDRNSYAKMAAFNSRMAAFNSKVKIYFDFY